MEKKNVIFLSVIAVATLLTAVIGTTFAYFTANFSVSNAGNATSTVQTKTLSGVTVTLGAPISGNPVYPGFKGVQEITVAGTAADVAGQFTLTVTPNIDSTFGNDVVWSLYKSDSAITCQKPVTSTTTGPNGNQISQTTSCSDVSKLTALISNDTTTANTAKTTATLTAPNGGTAKYYLVAEYKNNASASQNAAQGKSFGFTVSAKQVDNTTK